MPDAVRIALTLVAGVATGVLSGMFGIGGSVVSNPSIRALGASPIQSVGSTLPSIVPSAISGALRYRREGYLQEGIVVWVGATGALASLGGSQLSAVLPGDGHLLTIGIALLMAWTATRTVRSVAPPTPPVAEAELEMLVAEDGPRHTERWRLVVIGAVAGFASGLLGIGGGLVMVPAFSGWLRLGLKETIATSLSCVAIVAVPGMVNHARLGHVDWAFALPLAVGVVPGARLGAHITIGASERFVRILVGTGLGVLGVVYAAIEAVNLFS